MRLPITLHLLVLAMVITAGLALFASALLGVARIDTSLEVAATRATPDRMLVQEKHSDEDPCPYLYRSDREDV
jgi:hypothetical protein